MPQTQPPFHAPAPFPAPAPSFGGSSLPAGPGTATRSMASEPSDGGSPPAGGDKPWSLAKAKQQFQASMQWFSSDEGTPLRGYIRQGREMVNSTLATTVGGVLGYTSEVADRVESANQRLDTFVKGNPQVASMCKTHPSFVVGAATLGMALPWMFFVRRGLFTVTLLTAAASGAGVYAVGASTKRVADQQAAAAKDKPE